MKYQAFFLTCPERGLEQRWACRGGRWSATSAPPSALPSSSFPRGGLGPTGWAPQSLGRQESMNHTSLPSATHLCKDRTASYQMPRKPRQLREVINHWFKEVIKFGLRNLSCATFSFQPPTPSENKLLFSISKDPVTPQKDARKDPKGRAEAR